MRQRGNFPSVYNANIGAHIVELPYDDADNRFSMLILLPQRKNTLKNVFIQLKGFGVARILSNLPKVSKENQIIDLILPKFKLNAPIEMRSILQRMDVKQHLFDRRYDTRIIHNAVVEVDENGVTPDGDDSEEMKASEVNVAGNEGDYDDTMGWVPVIKADRPFGILIIERTANTILFAGQVRNPLKN